MQKALKKTWTQLKMRMSKRLQEKAERAALSLNVPSSTSGVLAKDNVRNRKRLKMQTTRKPAFHILPEDVWILIFKLLDNPMDRYNAMNVCQSFTDILRPTISTWLYPAISPHVFGHLSKTTALKCRQVCKTWKNGFDEMLELALCPKAVGRQSSIINIRATSQFAAQFRMEPNAHLVQNTWMHRLPAIKEHPSNPIIGRSVVFHYAEANQLQQEQAQAQQAATYLHNALRVAGDLGDHLQHIEFRDESPYRDGNTWNQFYSVLQSCLEFAPSLKTLSISQAATLEVDDDEDYDYLVELHPLENMFLQIPLPALQHLHTLILLPPDIPYYVHNELIRKYGPQLHHLKGRWNPFLSTVLYTTRARMLEEFSLCEVTGYNSSLVNITNYLVSPHLKQLQLSFDDDEDDSSWEMDKFLQFLANFPQLTFVDLSYGNNFIWKKCLAKYIAGCVVPTVKILKVNEIPGICYDFLECLPNLEELHVKKVDRLSYGYRVVDSKVRIVEHMYWGTLQESNVWTVLKKLKLVDFEWIEVRGAVRRKIICHNKCTREEYQTFMKNGQVSK